jgi:sulfite reductase (NADPH) flavoprotein alpha-component
MLVQEQLNKVKDFVSAFSNEELVWINGYLSGLLHQNNGVVNGNKSAGCISIDKITIAYATETGNAKKISRDFAAQAKKSGIQVKLVSLDQYRLTDLEKEEYFFVIISTHGEGEPPAAGDRFYHYLHTEKLHLPKLKFGVLALGDTAYPLFCKAGEDVDNQLKKSGATAIIDLKKCELDFEETARKWLADIFAILQNQTGTKKDEVIETALNKTEGKKIHTGIITKNINLNDSRSDKKTFHIEIALEENLFYEPGDSLGIYPENNSEVVEKIITMTGIDPLKHISTSKETASVFELLSSKLNICNLRSNTIKKYAAILGKIIPETRMDLQDLIHTYPVKDAAMFEEVIAILNPVAPRLYTISSSPSAHVGELHLTVAETSFSIKEENRFGVCSTFLGNMEVSAEIKFYIHKNRAFKLPAPDKDIIMIGPGTGIAPFRSFVAERDTSMAKGKNWLFFGERRFTNDFLYQTEWQEFAATGALHKINLAWSRDEMEKRYVQDEIIKESGEFIKWLDAGAHIYVCGNKTKMSVDVENAIIGILQTEKSLSAADARSYLTNLNKNGRYQKDVY